MIPSDSNTADAPSRMQLLDGSIPRGLFLSQVRERGRQARDQMPATHGVANSGPARRVDGAAARGEAAAPPRARDGAGHDAAAMPVSAANTPPSTPVRRKTRCQCIWNCWNDAVRGGGDLCTECGADAEDGEPCECEDPTCCAFGFRLGGEPRRCYAGPPTVGSEPAWLGWRSGRLVATSSAHELARAADADARAPISLAAALSLDDGGGPKRGRRPIWTRWPACLR